MQYIQKTGTQDEAKGVGCAKKIIDDSWKRGQYSDLKYTNQKVKYLRNVLIREQSERCCYCMRKLHIGESNNVTIEHIIPNKVSQDHWTQHGDEYRSYAALSDTLVEVCLDGQLPKGHAQILQLPHPHFLSYHNMVASCDGAVLADGQIKNQHCCNNRRGDHFVQPIFLNPQVGSLIAYDKEGLLDYDPDLICAESFGSELLNLECRGMVLIRKLWCLLANSIYSKDKVNIALTDKNMRDEIIDELTPCTQEWEVFRNDDAWTLFSEYDWFFDYYAKQGSQTVKP